MEASDRQRLIDFLASTPTDLSNIFEAAGAYITADVVERLWPAWEAVQARDELQDLAVKVASVEYDVGLDQAGLSGPELDFKLAGLSAAREAGLATPTPRWLKRWLRRIDLILGSLLAVIGVGESVKELKEGVEAELEASIEPPA